MSQVESLTIQILGDSSGLRQELNTIADLLDQFEDQLNSVSEGTGTLSRSFSGLSSALAPLQALGNELNLISQQVQQLASQPVTLNVQPALDALGQLMQSAQAAALQLAALSAASIPALPAGPMGGLPQAGSEGFPYPPRVYAGGGLVTGPGGIDQVPARLTAGEFVLTPEAVATLGTTQLERWNRGLDLSGVMLPPPAERPLARPSVPERPLSLRSPATSPQPRESPVQQTLNHFGGIEIHVRQQGDVDAVLHDLRRQGVSARHRWG